MRRCRKRPLSGNNCHGGHKHLIEFFIIKGANDWNRGMYAAAHGGHKHLVEFFVSKGANDWCRGIHGASLGGHKDLIEYFRQQLLFI